MQPSAFCIFAGDFCELKAHKSLCKHLKSCIAIRVPIRDVKGLEKRTAMIKC